MYEGRQEINSARMSDWVKKSESVYERRRPNKCVCDVSLEEVEERKW